MIDPAVHAELIHITKYLVEAFVAACFLTFIYLIQPYIRERGSR